MLRRSQIQEDHEQHNIQQGPSDDLRGLPVATAEVPAGPVQVWLLL